MSEWKIIVTDMAGRHLGPVGSYLSAAFAPRYNDVGSWSIVVPKWTPGYSLISIGRCISAYLDGVRVCSGPITSIDRHQNDAHPQPVYFVSGLTDEMHLQNRIMWVNPSGAATTQGGSASVGFTASPVSYIMESVVYQQMGPGAIASRRMNNFSQVVPNIGVGFGPSINTTWKFDNLLTYLRTMGLTYGVGFRMTRIEDTLNGGYVFQSFLPVNRASIVQFSEERGNLGDSTYSISSPNANEVLVGGTGPDTPGTPRPFVEVIGAQDLADWAMRIEYFDDRRDATAPAVLTQEGNETLTDQSAQSSISAQLFDGVLDNGVSTTRYGVDYFLGDVVRVFIDGVAIDDRVTQVTYTLEQNGAAHTTQPIVGNWQDTTNSLKIFKTVRAIVQRVGLLERRF